MPSTLSTTIRKIAIVPNNTNSALIGEYYQYIKTNDVSERHQNNSLKMVIAFANYLGKDISFYDIRSKEQITSSLNTKVKSSEAHKTVFSMAT